MEQWLIFALATAFLSAISGFFDNYLIDNHFKDRAPQAQKCFYGPAYAVFALLIFIFYPIFFGVEHYSVFAALFAFASGAISSLASIPYYFALKSENTTGAAIFFQLMPVIYLTLGAFFLGEQITGVTLVAFVILISAPLVIVLSTRKRGKKLEYKAAAQLLLYIFIFAISKIVFVFGERTTSGDGVLPLPMAVAFLLAGKGCIDIVMCVIFKKWRLRFKHVVEKSKKRVLIPFAINVTIWLGVELLYNSALVSGQVAVVSAVSTASQLISTFVLGLVLTILWPKFGLEKLDKRTVAAHLIATVLAVIGIILINKPEIFIGG